MTEVRAHLHSPRAPEPRGGRLPARLRLPVPACPPPPSKPAWPRTHSLFTRGAAYRTPRPKTSLDRCGTGSSGRKRFLPRARRALARPGDPEPLRCSTLPSGGSMLAPARTPTEGPGTGQSQPCAQKDSNYHRLTQEPTVCPAAAENPHKLLPANTRFSSKDQNRYPLSGAFYIRLLATRFVNFLITLYFTAQISRGAQEPGKGSTLTASFDFFPWPVVVSII